MDDEHHPAYSLGSSLSCYMPVLNVLFAVFFFGFSFAVLLFIGVDRMPCLQCGIDPNQPLPPPNHYCFSIGMAYSRLPSMWFSGFCGMLRLGCMDHGFIFILLVFVFLYVPYGLGDLDFGYTASIE